MEMRELGAKAGPMGRRTEVESRTLQAGGEDMGILTPRRRLDTGSSEADQSAQMALTEGELRD